MSAIELSQSDNAAAASGVPTHEPAATAAAVSQDATLITDDKMLTASAPAAPMALTNGPRPVDGQIHVKAGPMLKYDTTIDGMYHGFALIVTEDAASDYSQAPTIVFSGPTTNGQQTAQGKKIWQYNGHGGAHTFWRFEFNIQMQEGSTESPVQYQVSPGHVQARANQREDSVDPTKGYTFYIPGKEQNFRWAGHSCNGFSMSVNKEEYNGSNPLWDDMLSHHEKQHFHMVNGGGDQIYCDKLANEPELHEWHAVADPKKRAEAPLTQEISDCLERFFFTWYCEWFGTGTFSKTIAQIPMTNMLDDHDLIDGFGTYPDDWMLSPIFNGIGSRGYFYYLLFQQFIVDDVDGLDDSTHSNKAIILGEANGPYLRNVRNHSFLSYLGPKQYILSIDCRSERKLEQIVAPSTYARIFERVRQMPAGVEHLTILLGVPLAYPRMVFLEKTLSSKFNPLIMLMKGISPGFTNDFNGQVELLDDLNDHWCAAPHKKERNWLVEKVQEFAYEKRLRVSFISGDVHAGGVGVFLGYNQHNPSTDPKYMLAVITSAIVNAPPPPAVIGLLNRLAGKKHRSLFYRGTKETMVPLFEHGLDGKPQKQKYIVGARNWCAVTYQDASGELEFDLRVEEAKGAGKTKSYAVRAPAPRWEAKKEHTGKLHMKDFEAKVSQRFSSSANGGKEAYVKDPAAAAVVHPTKA